jgi:3-hydroxyacyl-[acyl-carrier-protein] dehydratase
VHFTLIDRIIELKPDERITAVKCLTMGEEYLQDHFPRFPVMPGVLMLESMYQAGSWLVRKSENFAHSMVTLKKASNVKYGNFVQPGQVLVLAAEMIKQDERHTTLKASGTVDGQSAVSARLVLERYNLGDEDEERLATDDYAREHYKGQFKVLIQSAKQV